MTKVAVIGVGSIGQHHARNYHQSSLATLVAVADATVSTGETVAKRHNVTYYKDYHQLLAQEKPDAVSIAVPTVTHFQVVQDALNAGCHVLVEKPIAATVEQGLKMVKMAQDANLILRVGHIERFNPAIIKLKSMLEDGSPGRIFQIHTRRLGPFPAHVKDVGVILDLAVHDLDIMRYLTSSEAVRLYAETSQNLHEAHEDIFSGNIRFANHTLGILEINWLTPTKIRKIQVTCEKGMFMADYLTQELYFYENREATAPEWEPFGFLLGVSEGLMTRYPINKVEPLRAEVENFILDTQDNKHRGATGMDGVMALKLAQKFIESGHQNQVIQIKQ